MAPKRKTQTGGGETSNPPPQKETSNPPPSPPQKETGAGKEILVRIDPDLLDCSICYHPLCSPVNQCDNGHVACTSCWSTLQHKCHICKVPVVTRNIALEKVLESVHLPCTYAHLGCHKYVSYSQRQVHTDTCEFVPSICPIPGCAHKAFSGDWQKHFIKDHQVPGIYYTYGEACSILFYEEDLYYTFVGPGKDLFLLVKEPILNVGYALSLYYIDLPDRGQNDFKYELKTRGCYNTITVKSNSPVISIKDWKRGEVSGSSLLVPLGFTGSRNTKVQVLITLKV